MSDIYKDVSDERKAMTFSVDHDDPIRNSYLEMMWNPSTSEETKKAAIAHYHTLGFEPVITEREIKATPSTACGALSSASACTCGPTAMSPTSPSSTAAG